MCASYGLDPRFDPERYQDAIDAQALERLREWAEKNAGATVRPTGKDLKNLNPLLVAGDRTAAFIEGWWGFLVKGAPSTFQSINTRSERLREQPWAMKQRAIVPATVWFEKRKSDGHWFDFSEGGELVAMAAVVQSGRLAGSDVDYTCYSIVMQPAFAHIAAVHDRMPVLVAPERFDDWLDDMAAPSATLLDAVIADSNRTSADIEMAGRSSSPLTTPRQPDEPEASAGPTLF